jgi:hypothetical protein
MFVRVIRAALVITVLAVAATACKGKTPGAAASSSTLVDLSMSLDAVRTAFNAHKQEARFLTLLSPA